MDSEMKTFIEQIDGDFPPPVMLGNFGAVPCHFLVDQGFALTKRFMRPFRYSEAQGNSKVAYFNYKLSRARRTVENYFGLLANRFRVLLHPIYAQPDTVKEITLAIMVLHNLLIDAIGPDSVVKRYGISNIFTQELTLEAASSVPADAKKIRETVMKFLCHRDGVR